MSKNYIRCGLLSGVACSAVMIMTPVSAQNASESGAAQASDAAGGGDAGGGEIIVTGFRGSLDKASALKRDSAVVSDVIASEDIGKYPDTNIAESLQRVTGVQITRNRGTGGTISVRGLSPAFVNTQLNGRQIISGGGRTFDFLTLSPDFVSSVAVMKSPTASMAEGGLSATVDVRTPRPLDIGKNTVAARLEGVYDELQKGVSPRVSAIANYANSDGTFGISVGGGYERLRNRTYSELSYGAETGVESAKNVDYNVDGDRADRYAFDHAQSYYVTMGVRERYSAIGGFQWKPSDGVELYGDILYTRLKDSADQYDAATRFTNIAPARAGAPFGVRSSTIDTGFNDKLLGGAQGFLTELDADGVDLRADRQPYVNRNSIVSGAMGAKYDADRFHLNIEGSYSRGVATRETSQASALARASVKIARPDGLGGQPTLTFQRGFDHLDPTNFNFVLIARNNNYSRDSIYNGKVDLAYDVGDGFIKNIRAGVAYSDRKLFSTLSRSTIDAATAARLSGGQLVYQPNVELGSLNAAPFLTRVDSDPNIPYWLGSYLTFDYDKFYKIVPLADVNRTVPFVEQQASRLDIQERTWAAYIQSDFSDADDRLSGNIGVRYVNTRQSSRGFGSDLDNLTFAADSVTTVVPAAGPLTVKNSYNYFLPSLNLRYKILDDLVVRFAAARVLARPNFDQLGVGLTVNANVLNINAANPNLKPYLSDQVDLSFEYYLPKSGLISLAFFYKNVNNFIIDGQVLDIRQVKKADGSTVPLTFRRNQPLNLETVKVKGIELGVQTPLDFIADEIEGFGVFGNATYIDAPKVPAVANGLPFPLPGVSKYSYNVGGYFEKSGFGARIYYNWRGSYDTGTANFFGDRQIQVAYGQIDGSISYDVTPEATVSLDFENLTKNESLQVNNFGLARGYLLNPRRVTLGVRAKF